MSNGSPNNNNNKERHIYNNIILLKGDISFADIIYLAEYVNASGPGPIPFQHLGDVDASGGDATQADVVYLFDYYFNYGPCPDGDWLISFDGPSYLAGP